MEDHQERSAVSCSAFGEGDAEETWCRICRVPDCVCRHMRATLGRSRVNKFAGHIFYLSLDPNDFTKQRHASILRLILFSATRFSLT
jgi:hypothetical protein